MLRRRFPPLGLKPTLGNFFKNTLIGSVAYLASSSIKMRVDPKKYQQ